MNKKDKNLQVSCEDGDIELLDSLRGHFEFFPPKRSELARVLLRFAMSKVKQNPHLLKAISRLFQDAIIADIGAIDGAAFARRFDAETERRLEAAERHGMSRAESVSIMLRIGGRHFEAMGYEDAAPQMEKRKAG